MKTLIGKDPDTVREVIDKLRVMLSQLNLMEGYVENILNLAMIKAQNFNLNFSDFRL